jgi:hypothetical protein
MFRQTSGVSCPPKQGKKYISICMQTVFEVQLKRVSFRFLSVWTFKILVYLAPIENEEAL